MPAARPRDPSQRRNSRVRMGSAGRYNWRKAVASPDSESSDGPHNQEDIVEASRARREAILARRNVVELDPDQSPPVIMVDDVESVSTCDDAARSQDDADGHKKRINRFQASVGDQQQAADMFDENTDTAALNHDRSLDGQRGQNIAFTGASADDWDDKEGYYQARIGEKIADRYLVLSETSGKGTFSNVVKATDEAAESADRKDVAIKVIRGNDAMRVEAEREISILRTLNNADKDNRRHIVRLYHTFVYRQHLCLVFECMLDNLRNVMSKHGRGNGLGLEAVRTWSKQLFIGLRLLKKFKFVHADIKPDNILLSDNNVLKICDLGSAFPESECKVTDLLVSRYYRPPEVILGCKYSCQVDVWSSATTLAEIYTGKVMFKGRTNNDMLKEIMDVKGKVPRKLINMGKYGSSHFTRDAYEFKYEDYDRATRTTTKKILEDNWGTRDIEKMLMAKVSQEKRRSQDPQDLQYCRKVRQFAEFIHRCCMVDPDKRFDPAQALHHDFLKEPFHGRTVMRPDLRRK
mmetsp:Transcript_18327/g.39371  ORF Transcript_18327/g.39371 Transcript_18327/m.39371 type:complete len:521 (+) Transcript_18327:2-1564(+)